MLCTSSGTEGTRSRKPPARSSRAPSHRVQGQCISAIVYLDCTAGSIYLFEVSVVSDTLGYQYLTSFVYILVPLCLRGAIQRPRFERRLVSVSSQVPMNAFSPSALSRSHCTVPPLSNATGDLVRARHTVWLLLVTGQRRYTGCHATSFLMSCDFAEHAARMSQIVEDSLHYI